MVRQKPDPAPVATTAGIPSRDRYLILICLAIITALSWAYLVHLAHHPSSTSEYAEMMAAMGMAIDRPWTPVDMLLTFSMWSVMMVGMMTGAAAPTLMLFAGAHARRTGRRMSVAVLLFGAGYFCVWLGFSAIATVAQWTLQRATLLNESMAASRPGLGAAILIGVGIYQLTPIKNECLTHCQSPLGFLMTHWQDGASGAFRMGAHHGVFCLGCCWALMIVLFAVGVMNLLWVIALTAIVLMEKITPFGLRLSRVGGMVMVAGGIYLLM